MKTYPLLIWGVGLRQFWPSAVINWSLAQASRLKLRSSSQTWLVLLEVLERFEQILAAGMALEEKLSEG